MPKLTVKKAIIKGFKSFENRTFEFNEDVNILVGDNDVGKSTVLEAIEIALLSTFRGKPLAASISTALFNREQVTKYLASNKDESDLPEIRIELFVDGEPQLRGRNNSLRENVEGVYVKIAFDPFFSEPYDSFVKQGDGIQTIPVEFYRWDWFSFADEKMSRYNIPLSCVFIDPVRMHPTFGRNKYIRGILDSAITQEERSTLNLAFRQLKGKFDNDPSVVKINQDLDKDGAVTEKNLAITASVSAGNSWESSLQISLNNIPFDQEGRGEQNQVQIKLGLLSKSEEADLILIEEPENHLSHLNLVGLVDYIEKRSGSSQLFLTTHSSFVLNKLNFSKVCLISEGYSRFKDVDSRTVRRLKRLPGYDTLRSVLAKKVVLVEGPSDEIIIKKMFMEKFDVLPEMIGIDVIVVRGIGFKNYLNILKELKHPVHVVKDNDGKHQKNILDWWSDYEGIKSFKIFSPKDDSDYSLEPALISSNSESIQDLNRFAKIALSATTYKKYYKGGLADRQDYLKGWFADAGGKKVDSAIRIFESKDRIFYPDYLIEALSFE